MEHFFFISKYISYDIAFWISIFVRAKLLSKQVRYRKNPLFPTRCSSLFIHICIYVCKNWWWMMQISLLNTERLLLQRDSSFITLSLYVNGKKVSIHKTYKTAPSGTKARTSMYYSDIMHVLLVSPEYIWQISQHENGLMNNVSWRPSIFSVFRKEFLYIH